MHRLKGHIAALLIGIFIYPMVFHVMHVGVHSEDAHSSCHDHESERQTEWFSILNGDPSEDCAACDYEFSVNDEPQPQLYLADIDVEAIHYFGFGVSEHELELRAVKSPRAPPARLI